MTLSFSIIPLEATDLQYMLVCFAASSELNAEMSSIGEEGSEWDSHSDVAMVTGVGGSSRGTPQAEKEMR